MSAKVQDAGEKTPGEFATQSQHNTYNIKQRKKLLSTPVGLYKQEQNNKWIRGGLAYLENFDFRNSKVEPCEISARKTRV